MSALGISYAIFSATGTLALARAIDLTLSFVYLRVRDDKVIAAQAPDYLMPFNEIDIGRRDVYDLPSGTSPTWRQRLDSVAAPGAIDVEPRQTLTCLSEPDNIDIPKQDPLERMRGWKRKSEPWR